MRPFAGKALRVGPAVLLGVIAALLLSYAGVRPMYKLVHAQVAGAFLSGYAWSDTIGWIQMYSVNLLADASTLSGYAWSDNIGWISFNQADLAGCPSGTCKAWFSTVNGQVALQGWARACAGTTGGNCTGTSRTDGWDGWIALNDQTGGTYGPKLYPGQTSGLFATSSTNYSWGSDVVGWIDWSNVSLSGAATTDNSLKVTANPGKVRKGMGFSTLTWTGVGISTSTGCTISSSPSVAGFPKTVSSSPTTGNTTVTGITINTTFTVNCGAAGTASTQVGVLPVVQEI